MKNKKEKLAALKAMENNSESKTEDNPMLEPTATEADDSRKEMINRKFFKSSKKNEAEEKAKKAQPLSDVKLEELMKIVKKLKNK